MRNHTLQSSHSCSTLHKPRPCGSPRSSDTPNPSFVVFLPSSLQFLHSGIISGTANTDEVSFQTSAVPSPRAAPHSSGSACPASAELWRQGNQLKAAKVSGGGVLKAAETVPLSQNQVRLQRGSLGIATSWFALQCDSLASPHVPDVFRANSSHRITEP